VSYERATLNGCGTSLGILPLVAAGGKALLSKAAGAVFSGARQYNDPVRVAGRIAQQVKFEAMTPEQIAQSRATVSAFQARGIGTALDRIMGRGTTAGKPSRNPLLLPAVTIAPTPGMPVPLPITPQPVTATPVATMATSVAPTDFGSSSGGGGGGGGGGGSPTSSSDEEAPTKPSGPGAAPLVIGGIILLALFSRRKRKAA
jgi:hypothetical protein